VKKHDHLHFLSVLPPETSLLPRKYPHHPHQEEEEAGGGIIEDNPIAELAAEHRESVELGKRERERGR